MTTTWSCSHLQACIRNDSFVAPRILQARAGWCASHRSRKTKTYGSYRLERLRYFRCISSMHEIFHSTVVVACKWCRSWHARIDLHVTNCLYVRHEHILHHTNFGTLVINSGDGCVSARAWVARWRDKHARSGRSSLWEASHCKWRWRSHLKVPAPTLCNATYTDSVYQKPVLKVLQSKLLMF